MGTITVLLLEQPWSPASRVEGACASFKAHNNHAGDLLLELAESGGEFGTTPGVFADMKDDGAALRDAGEQLAGDAMAEIADRFEALVMAVSLPGAGWEFRMTELRSTLKDVAPLYDRVDAVCRAVDAT